MLESEIPTIPGTAGVYVAACSFIDDNEPKQRRPTKPEVVVVAIF